MADEPIITEKTFTQAEVDEIVGKRVARAMKGMPSTDELNAYNEWKSKQPEEIQRLSNLTNERDTFKTQLAEANAKLQSYEQEKLLLSKGVKAEDVDYYAFKINQLVTAEKDFNTAMEEYLADHKPATVRVDGGGNLGGGGQTPQTANSQMNDIFRNFRK